MTVVITLVGVTMTSGFLLANVTERVAPVLTSALLERLAMANVGQSRAIITQTKSVTIKMKCGCALVARCRDHKPVRIRTA